VDDRHQLNWTLHTTGVYNLPERARYPTTAHNTNRDTSYALLYLRARLHCLLIAHLHADGILLTHTHAYLRFYRTSAPPGCTHTPLAHTLSVPVTPRVGERVRTEHVRGTTVGRLLRLVDGAVVCDFHHDGPPTFTLRLDCGRRWTMNRIWRGHQPGLTFHHTRFPRHHRRSAFHTADTGTRYCTHPAVNAHTPHRNGYTGRQRGTAVVVADVWWRTVSTLPPLQYPPSERSPQHL